ncbi:hypothetical protein MPSEU_000161800 [Mayamaea pseudoterrestris]|nr:hypothetical protein MPSEU_000161800 [Mayamaea pseudoterrestris]
MKSISLLAFVPSYIVAFQISSQSSRQRRSSSSFTRQWLSDVPMLQAETDDEWHPHDPAATIPQLLHSVWSQIAQAGNMVKGESLTVIYPEMKESLANPNFVNQILGHLDYCKDVCDHFGISTTLVPYKQMGRIAGFTAKSFKKERDSNQPDGDEKAWDYDPFWDDGTDFDELYKGIDDEFMTKDPYPAIVNKVPENDESIIDLTKDWVSKMMADMGICPFTKDANEAGLPLGEIYYCVDRSSGVEDVYARYWREVVRVETLKEKDLSTTLMIVPEFFLDNVELFESFSTTLTQSLTFLKVEDLLQLVFFHPHWSFRDGDARAGEGQAANYARRSPWPMINLLRTTQVRTAQKGIPTGLVYKQNEKTLSSIGVDKLETMLRLRDWGEISDMKVNRREMDALKIAQDFQATGKVKDEDMSLNYDSTPAANKVDKRQVEQGNLIKVVMQALEKRLGKNGHAMQPLNGPETSATAMAVDFLLQRLDGVEMAKPEQASVSVAENKDDGLTFAERERQKRMAEARAAMLADLTGQDEEAGPDLTDVVLGKAGILESKKDDDTLKGIDPATFF